MVYFEPGGIEEMHVCGKSGRKEKICAHSMPNIAKNVTTVFWRIIIMKTVVRNKKVYLSSLHDFPPIIFIKKPQLTMDSSVQLYFSQCIGMC